MIDVRDALKALARKDASVRPAPSKAQRSAVLRSTYSTFTQERHRQRRKSLYNLSHGSAHRREDLCSTAKSILLEQRPPAMSSPGSQSVSALHLLLASKQGASAAGHRFGRQGCTSKVPHWSVSTSAEQPSLILALSPRRTTYHQVSRDRSSASSDLSCKIFAQSC
jgi:hypothetical protein